MEQIVSVLLSTDDHVQPTAVIGDRNRLQKRVHRFRTIFLSADRVSVAEVTARLGQAARRTARIPSAARG